MRLTLYLEYVLTDSHSGEKSQVIHPGVELQNLGALWESTQALGSFPPSGGGVWSLSTAFEEHAHVVGLMVSRTMPVTKIIIVSGQGKELYVL